MHNSLHTLANRSLKRLFQALFVGTLALLTSMAFALPAPKDIEQAVQAGNYQQAETLVREVLREKPESAKAHYELGQILARQSRMPEAHKALIRAQELDPALKFTNQPEKFRDLFARTGAPAPGATVSSGLQSTPVVTPSAGQSSNNAQQRPAAAEGIGSSIPMSYVWIGLIGVGILAFLLVRNARNSSQPQPTAAYGNALATAGGPQRGFGGQPGGFGGQPGYGGYGPGAAPNSGPGAMTGAVVGGLAGVAAGYALSKALEGNHHDAGQQSLHNSPASDQFQPMSSAPSQDFGAFDSGAGDSWDSGGDSSGGGGDDW
jgi:tetratricopeptide (TPR) repeat protein